MNEYVFDEIKLGLEASFNKKITPEMESLFRKISGDENPLHKDDEFAKEVGKGKLRGHVSFGMLTASFYSTIAGMYLPGKYSLIHSLEDLSFKKPVYVGDELTVTGKVIDKNDELRLIVLKVSIKNQNKDLVSKAKMKVLVMK